jgi:hypothetical protein
LLQPLTNMLHHDRNGMFELQRCLEVGQVKLLALHLYRSAHNFEALKFSNNRGIIPLSHPIIRLAAKLADVLEFLGHVCVRISNKTGVNLVWKCHNEFTRMVRLERCAFEEIIGETAWKPPPNISFGLFGTSLL